MVNRDFVTDSVEPSDNSRCAFVERVPKKGEEWEQSGGEIERIEREIREQRARKKREGEAREQEEASRWPQQQATSTGHSQQLCKHKRRHCRVRFSCCKDFYPCQICHNNSKKCRNKEAKSCDATHLKCSFCQHEQEVSVFFLFFLRRLTIVLRFSSAFTFEGFNKTNY